jgi:DNA-binding transcriptional ArsR family regulator
MPGMAAALDVVLGDDRLRGGLSPLRRRILEELREPGSATSLAVRMGEARQRVNYHLRELEKAGLLELVEERQRRGCVERVVRATAHAVVTRPDVVGDLSAVTQDRFATDTLLAGAAHMLVDVAAMREHAGRADKRLVTFAVEADVGFAEPADVRRFADELADLLAGLAARYDAPGAGPRYRVVVGGHPTRRSDEDGHTSRRPEDDRHTTPI